MTQTQWHQWDEKDEDDMALADGCTNCLFFVLLIPFGISLTVISTYYVIQFIEFLFPMVASQPPTLG